MNPVAERNHLVIPTDCFSSALTAVEQASSPSSIGTPIPPHARGSLQSVLSHGVPPLRRRASARRMYLHTRLTLQLTSNQSREDSSPFRSSASPPPLLPPVSAPSNADIEAVIQMATSKQSLLPVPKDTRTQLFVGNVGPSSFILSVRSRNRSSPIEFAGRILKIFFARLEPFSGQMFP